jgi:hypothetical protein
LGWRARRSDDDQLRSEHLNIAIGRFLACQFAVRPTQNGAFPG